MAMDIAPTVLDRIRQRVGEILSAKRYAHTLGVERAACVLGERLLPHKCTELCAAALLHDITKEYTEEEQHALLAQSGVCLPDDERGMSALLHSHTAPQVILRDFPEAATAEVLSAVACHTTGKADMSIFEKIIFIADYIEEGRTYPACISVRNRLYDRLSHGDVPPEVALDEAVLAALDSTITALLARGSLLCVRTVLARNALIGSIYRD